MMTQTHLLVACGVLSRPERHRHNWAIILGALLPDVSIFIMVVWVQIQRFFGNYLEFSIWEDLYWREPWQTYGAISNSFLLFWLLYCAGFYMARANKEWIATGLLCLASAALLHLALDYPVHASDAHKHFWPFSEWRFHAPISYWEPGHHNQWVSLMEAVLAGSMIAVLWRRFKVRWVRGLLFITALLYLPTLRFFL